MNNLIHADIFFFVSTILLSLVAAVFIVVLIYIIKVLREARGIAEIARKEAERIAGDLEMVREKIREETSSMGNLLSLVSGFLAGKKRSRTTKRKE